MNKEEISNCKTLEELKKLGFDFTTDSYGLILGTIPSVKKVSFRGQPTIKSIFSVVNLYFDNNKWNFNNSYTSTRHLVCVDDWNVELGSCKNVNGIGLYSTKFGWKFVEIEDRRGGGYNFGGNNSRQCINGKCDRELNLDEERKELEIFIVF